MIVTPTYNEIDNLRQFLAAVFEVVPQAHVLVVDDNSPDGTGDLAEKISEEDPRVLVLRRPGKLGLGTAYIDAFSNYLEAGYETFFEMDTESPEAPVSYMLAVPAGRAVPGSPARRR